MNDKAQTTLLAGLDKALLIALATPIAYFLAFQYDVGFLGFFGIPNALVDVSLKDLLIAAATLGSLGYFVYVYLDMVLIFSPEHWPPRIKSRVMWLFWIAMGIVLLLRLIDVTRTVWVVALAIIMVLAFFLVARPIIRRESPTDVPRIDRDAHKGVIPTLIRRGVEQRLVSAALLIIAACIAANVVGDAQARMQTSFLVHFTDKGGVCAAIRMRDKDLLCADFNVETQQLTGDYNFLPTESTTLSLRDIGRLKSPDVVKAIPTPPGDQNPFWLREME